MKLTKTGLFLSLSIVAVSLTAACQAEVGDEDDDEDFEQSADGLTQGGCSNAQIRTAQASCKGQCKSAKKVSRGIRYCYPPIANDPFATQIRFACVCGK